MQTSLPFERIYSVVSQSQFFRYLIVGTVALTVDTGVLFILTHFFHLFYLISAAAGFTIGLIVNYLLSVTWVFPYRRLEQKYFEFALFAIIGILGLGWTELLMFLFVDKFGMYFLYGKIATAGIVFFWNFFARKFILFYKRERR